MENKEPQERETQERETQDKEPQERETQDKEMDEEMVDGTGLECVSNDNKELLLSYQSLFQPEYETKTIQFIDKIHPFHDELLKRIPTASVNRPVTSEELVTMSQGPWGKTIRTMDDYKTTLEEQIQILTQNQQSLTTVRHATVCVHTQLIDHLVDIIIDYDNYVKDAIDFFPKQAQSLERSTDRVGAVLVSLCTTRVERDAEDLERIRKQRRRQCLAVWCCPCVFCYFGCLGCWSFVS